MKCSRVICLLLAAAIALCCCTGVAAEFDDAYPDLEYEIFEADGRRQARITAYYGYESFVSLPDMLGGVVVTELGSSLFAGNQNLHGVIFPSQLEVIGDACFMSCTNLKEALLPRTVRYIGSIAFLQCTNLETIDLHRPIEYIGEGALELTAWRRNHPDWYNRLVITEVSTAQELAEQMISDPEQSGLLISSNYDRQELHILNDIDCTGIPLHGALLSPVICGWDAQTNRPAMRKISNADFTLLTLYSSNSTELHGCRLCREQGQSREYDEGWHYFCQLHDDCREQCPDCHTGQTQSSMLLGIISEEISYLTLDDWTVHSPSSSEETICCDQATVGQAHFMLTMNAGHLNITNLRYMGANYKETVNLVYSMGMVQDVYMENLRFDLTENGQFENVLPLQGTRLERCLVAGVELSAPAEVFYAMAAVEESSDLLVRDIHAKSVSRYCGLFAGTIVTRVVIRDMTLEQLSNIRNDGMEFIGITAAHAFLSSPDDMQKRATFSQVVVDVPDPLLTTPVSFAGSPNSLSPTFIRLEQFYYTDETGRFDPARDFLLLPDKTDLSTDGIYCVTREQLCSQETLDALNQPLEPGVDKTTGNRWSRDDSYCGGCPVPAACSPSSPCAPVIAYGDVDATGGIDASDALCILQASVRLREFSDNQAEAADVNGDYRVDAADALLVLQHSVHLIDRFPMEPYPSLFDSVAQ